MFNVRYFALFFHYGSMQSAKDNSKELNKGEHNSSCCFRAELINGFQVFHLANKFKEQLLWEVKDGATKQRELLICLNRHTNILRYSRKSIYFCLFTKVITEQKAPESAEKEKIT